MTTQPNTCECPYCHQAIKVESGIVLDKFRHNVERNGRKVHLTPQQFDLFALLHGRIGRPVRHGTVYDSMFGARPDCDQPCNKIIPVLMVKLRRSIKPLGLEIKTLWGVGFELRTVAETQESKAA